MKRKKGSVFLATRNENMELNIILAAVLTAMLPAFAVRVSGNSPALQDGTLYLMGRATLSGLKNPREKNAAS
jgi:hypothetical protein